MFDAVNSLRANLKTQEAEKAMLDSAAGQAAGKIENGALDIAALNGDLQQTRLVALFIVWTLVDAIIEGELDEEELPTDLLEALIAGFAGDEDESGEIELDDVAHDVFVANIKDAFETMGVDVDTVEAIFGDDIAEAEEALQAAAEIVIENTPTNDEDIQALVNQFAYGEADSEDGEFFDALTVGKKTIKTGKVGKVVYKAVKAIRNGKLKIVNKRISGKVKLSAKQRSALRKASRKASTGSAVRKRVRSARKHKAMNI